MPACSSFYAGMLVGSVAGARIVREPGRSVAALWGSAASSWPGVANLFPLSVPVALGADGRRTDAANGLS